MQQYAVFDPMTGSPTLATIIISENNNMKDLSLSQLDGIGFSTGETRYIYFQV